MQMLKPLMRAIDLRRCASPAVERVRGRTLSRIRQHIAVRDELVCQVCRRLALHGQVDHIMPLHLGGAESDSNRQWICPKCHGKKNQVEERERIAQ